MPLLRPFRAIPQTLREWTQFFENLQVIPDDGSTEEEQIADNAVTNTKLRDSAATSVIGRASGSTGDPADIVAANNGEYLRRTGGALLFGSILEADIPATITRDTEVTAAIAALNLASGVYTPTLTDVANVANSDAYQCQYMRVGSVVTVSGLIDVDPAVDATETQIGISLPIASDFAAEEDCAGTAHSITAQRGAGIYADITNNRAEMRFLANDTDERAMFFQFQYRVI
jgi:hypothetical protein